MTFPALTAPHPPTLLPTRLLSPPSTHRLRKCVTGNKCHLPGKEEEEGVREDFDCAPVVPGKKPEVSELPSCEGRPL